MRTRSMSRSRAHCRAKTVFMSRVFGVPTKQALSRPHLLLLIDVQDAVFPGWWMNEGGQSSTGQVRQTSFTFSLD